MIGLSYVSTPVVDVAERDRAHQSKGHSPINKDERTPIVSQDDSNQSDVLLPIPKPSLQNNNNESVQSKLNKVHGDDETTQRLRLVLTNESDSKHQLTKQPSNVDIIPSQSNESGSTIRSTEMIEIKKKNKRLQEENRTLMLELRHIGEKLKYLEYTLGVVEQDIDNNAGNQGGSDDGPNENRDPEEASREKQTQEAEELEETKEEAKEESDSVASTASKEIKRLTEMNGKMLQAIKALAKAAINQKDKHYRYKKKTIKTKKRVHKVTKEMSQALVEKQEARSSFLKTQSQFLQEQDKREEIQDEILRLASQVRSFKMEKEREDFQRRRILRELEEEKYDPIMEDSILNRKRLNTDDADVESAVSSDDELGRSKTKTTMELNMLNLQTELEKKTELIDYLQAKIDKAKSYLNDALESRREGGNNNLLDDDYHDADEGGFTILPDDSMVESEVSLSFM